MITIDAPISFLLGSGLAYATSQKKHPAFIETFQKGLILQSCVLTPVILFFMLRFPDWEWNYLFNAKEFFFSDENIGQGATILAVIAGLLNLTYIIGFKVTEKLVAEGRSKVVVPVLGVTTLLILGTMGVMYEQTLFIGTLEEFRQGEAELIFTNPAFLAAQTSAGLLLAGGIFLTLKTKAGD